MVTTSGLEDLKVDLNGAMSNYLRLALLVLLSTLLIALLHVCRSYKRLCRELLYMDFAVKCTVMEEETNEDGR